MITEEYKLYTRCKDGKKVSDCENYFMTFPNGEHIDHIRGWYQSILTDYLNNLPVREKIGKCKEYRMRLDNFRKTDMEHANYWSSLISNVASIADNAHHEYVMILKAKKGEIGAKAYAQMFDESLLTDSDYLEIGLTKEDVRTLKNFTSHKKIDIKQLDKEVFDKNGYKLPDKCTEIYFWGMPSSGKSCCLSAILSTASNNGYCGGYEAGISGNTYFEQLTNIFQEDGGMSTLISGTNTNSIASASYKMIHPKHGTRRMCLIDLAGETFKSMHKVNNNESIDDEALQLCLDVTRNYLLDSRNRKLHFFVVPYNDKETPDRDGYTTSQYLQACATYLQNDNIIKDTADGIFIVVTKADKMNCAPEDYKAKAEEYIKTRYKSFYNSMGVVRGKEGLGRKGIEILHFSIGEMITPEICKFNAQGAEDFIDLLCKKSIKEPSWWRIILDKIFGL